MALELKIELCSKENCKKLQVKDITGPYDASDNTTGWGSPNLDEANVTVATIKITAPGGTVQTENILTQITDPMPDTLTFNDITLDDTSDGFHTIVYSVTDGNLTSTVTKKIFLNCAVRCCVFEKLYKKLDEVSNCGCDVNLDFENYLYNLYEAMRYNAGGCSEAKAKSYLTLIQNICNSSTNTDCGCT